MNPKRPAKRKKTNAITSTPLVDAGLLDTLRGMIVQAREGVARTIDAALTTLHWHIGRRIREDILKNERAEYGREIVSAPGRQLSTEFGRGFDEKSLLRRQEAGDRGIS